MLRREHVVFPTENIFDKDAKSLEYAVIFIRCHPYCMYTQNQAYTNFNCEDSEDEFPHLPPAWGLLEGFLHLNWMFVFNNTVN